MIDKPKLIQFEHVVDARGNLAFAEGAMKDFPFKIERTFWITGVPNGQQRGNHAHYKSKQVLIALQGKIKIELEDLNSKKYKHELSSSSVGLYIPAMIWGSMNFFNDAIALSLASDAYDEHDYMRDYDQFCVLKSKFSKNGNTF